LMLVIFLLIPVITTDADEPQPLIIKIGINKGHLMPGSVADGRITNALNYSWVVNNNEYVFNNTIMNISNDKNVYLDYDVNIIDGVTDEIVKCIRDLNPLKTKNFRDMLELAISSRHGYIGRCGGSGLPPQYDKPRPDGMFEYYAIEQNAFLEDIKVHANIDVQILSQFYKMQYWTFINRPERRQKENPGAIGLLAYSSFGSDDPSAINSSKNIHGYYVDLEKLNYAHPILKDYYGDTLYTQSMGGGGFPIKDLPDYVDALAYFPPECTDKNPKQDISIWECRPTTKNMVILLKQLFKFCKDNPLRELSSIDDIPDWVTDLINTGTRNVTWWYRQNNNKKIETEIQNLPAIIAFEYQNGQHGRVVLSGPHVANPVLADKNAEIIDMEKGRGVNRSEGLYHWQKSDDTWADKSLGDLKPNEDLHWYQRREAAWASSNVPDDHLPPVYGRSQVVDINPEYQTSPEFIIECCVGKNTTEKWNWYDVNLTLYYRYTSSPGERKPDWSIWETIYTRPYSFIFDSPNGPGIYEFCSRLKTEDSEYGVVQESFPPEPDAIAYVQTPIHAELAVNGSHILSGDLVYFNSSNSVTYNGTNITYRNWSFGDGRSSTNQNPTHAFLKKGVYNVTLTIENNEGDNDSIYKIIEIHNNIPNVNFIVDKQIVFKGEIINFTDNSNDLDGEIVNYIWDFDDDSNSTQQNISHSYTQSGFYTVSLKITDDDNDTDSMMNDILVIDSLVNKSQTPSGNIYNNIMEALDNTSYGEYLYVEDGSYNENISINKSINLIGADKNNVIVHGSITINNPHDFELPMEKGVDLSIIVNMTGSILLMRFNNETAMGENYSNSNLVYDYSGENNNGNNSGATWTTSTIKGSGAFMFDGVDDSINISCLPDLGDSCVTVSGWVFWTNDSSIVDPIVTQKNGLNGYILYINGSTGKPVFCLNNINAESNVSISFGEWHHIVGTYDGEILKIYVDGCFAGSNNTAGLSVNTCCYIGCDNNNNFYSGILDEICIWNRTLPSDEIRLIYDGNKHIVIEGITFRDSDVGLRVCNHSEIVYCDFINNTIGLLLDDASDTEISMCNITSCTTGIKIINSIPENFYYNNIVDCYIDDTVFGIVIENSSYINFIRDLVNGTEVNMSFNEDSDFYNISTIDCDSPFNVAPFAPSLWGPGLGEINKSYSYYACTNDSNDDQILFRFDWDDGNISSWLHLYGSNETANASHVWSNQGGYLVKVMAKDVFDNESNWSSPMLFRTETLPPIINSFNNNPNVVGFGGGINIVANVSDDKTGNYSGIKTTYVNVTFPDNSICNYSMNSVAEDVFEFVFSDTWLVGQYNYTIVACDNAYNWNNSNVMGCFNVSAQANMSICTIKDSYGSNEIINLTDPPSSNPPSQDSIGYELLDNNSVLHVWNNFDHYYFNTTSGIQLTNHYNKYWSHNVLILGYYNNDQWHLIYRTDELSGFNKNIESDNKTYINATIWKNLSYQGYDFRLALRYHLGVDDKELTVIPYIKNLGQTIPFNLGFAWEIKDIQVNMTPSGDYIEINGTSNYLNQSLDETYKNINQSCFYIREDISSDRSESLYLCWNDSLDYLVKVKSRTGQYNAPVTLGIKIGTLSVDQEKYTTLLWHDASEITLYFSSYNAGETWATNPGYMVDGNTSTYASTTVGGVVELCNGNTCPALNLGNIIKVELRTYGYYTGTQHNIILRPVFNGTTDGMNYDYRTTTTPYWSQWFEITTDPTAPPWWNWTKVNNLDCDVEAKSGYGSFTLYCSKVEIRVTYIPNSVPVISNPYPINGSTGISITPTLNITVSDPDGDSMDITWFSNSSGSWQVFGTNNSVGSGTYCQTFSNATVNGGWWYWKVYVTDGMGYNESGVFSFFTGNESKIKNTGSTNISGYLLIQIQFNDSGIWVFDSDVVNESYARTVAVGAQLGLDEIFNVKEVNTNFLTYGGGTYRVYAAFRDPEGNILQCDDDSLLKAIYEFSVTLE
jgi:PKD repeat protein